MPTPDHAAILRKFAGWVEKDARLVGEAGALRAAADDYERLTDARCSEHGPLYPISGECPACMEERHERLKRDADALVTAVGQFKRWYSSITWPAGDVPHQIAAWIDDIDKHAARYRLAAGEDK